MTPELLEAALMATGGVKSLAAQRLNVTPSAISHFIERHPDTWREIHGRVMGTLLDLAEGKLIEKVRDGSERMITYFLDNHGGERGYGKKLKLTGDPEHPVHTKDVGKPDLAALVREGKLSRDDLKTMRAIAAKIEAGAHGSAGA